MARAVLAIVVVLATAVGALGYTAVIEGEAVESLEIELIDVSLEKVGLKSCDISLKLKFTNPTERGAPISWISSYSIYINDNYVVAGALPLTRVPANSTIYRETKIVIEYESS